MRSSLVLALAFVACGDNSEIAPDANAPARVATGTHLVARHAVVGGITADGYIAFYDFDEQGHAVAKVIPISGGDEIELARSDGTGKVDVRFEIRGGVVFAWTDRGNRVANLTIWSKGSGVIPVGAGVRPG